jgi:hypothetical protein
MLVEVVVMVVILAVVMTIVAVPMVVVMGVVIMAVFMAVVMTISAAVMVVVVVVVVLVCEGDDVGDSGRGGGGRRDNGNAHSADDGACCRTQSKCMSSNFFLVCEGVMRIRIRHTSRSGVFYLLLLLLLLLLLQLLLACTYKHKFLLGVAGQTWHRTSICVWV